jgi:hypothetical protein
MKYALLITLLITTPNAFGGTSAAGSAGATAASIPAQAQAKSDAQHKHRENTTPQSPLLATPMPFGATAATKPPLKPILKIRPIVDRLPLESVLKPIDEAPFDLKALTTKACALIEDGNYSFDEIYQAYKDSVQVIPTQRTGFLEAILKVMGYPAQTVQKKCPHCATYEKNKQLCPKLHAFYTVYIKKNN